MFFSANENLALRQHKRRIIEYVEETIPESALDAGTNVMVMQVSCRDPGCVPLETAIAIVFPRPLSSSSSTKKKKKKKTTTQKPLIQGLEESATGGTFKTKILLPMADVTKEDVLEALPPQFKGGKRTMEKLCLRARDVMLSQITQIMGTEDEEGRKLMAVYLKECLEDYMSRGCVAPEFGEAFLPIDDADDGMKKDKEEEEEEGKGGTIDGELTTSAATTIVKDTEDTSKDEATNSDVVEEKLSTNEEGKSSLSSSTKATTTTTTTTAAETVARGMAGTGNFVFRRVLDDDDDDNNNSKNNTKPLSIKTKPSSSSTTITETAMDWRRKQNEQKSISNMTTKTSAIQKLAEREHAPGIRRPGCPCCDIDNPSNVVDEMLML